MIAFDRPPPRAKRSSRNTQLNCRHLVRFRPQPLSDRRTLGPESRQHGLLGARQDRHGHNRPVRVLVPTPAGAGGALQHLRAAGRRHAGGFRVPATVAVFTRHDGGGVEAAGEAGAVVAGEAQAGFLRGAGIGRGARVTGSQNCGHRGWWSRRGRGGQTP